MPLQRPEAVVFDMDGLLFDTEALYEEAIQAAAKETGHDFAPATFRRMLGGTWLENRALLLNHFGDAFPIDDLHAAWMRHFNLMVQTRLTLKPGAAELRCLAPSPHPPSITMCNITSRPMRLPAALTSSWRMGITRQASRPRIRS
jgi:beta-phosphoglucomutase-like phosphatase (HAD superfamily)